MTGNVVSKDGVSYAYDDPAHAVTGLSDGSSYSYDANGNRVTHTEDGVTYEQAFDAETRLVVVTNTTSGETESYLWSYGDWITSTASAVTHTHAYTATGVYTVSLTATGPGGSDTLTRTNYIIVSSGGGYTTTTTVVAYTWREASLECNGRDDPLNPVSAVPRLRSGCYATLHRTNGLTNDGTYTYA